MARWREYETNRSTAQRPADGLSRRSFVLAGSAVAATWAISPAAFAQTKFRRISTQFIAALGDPQAKSGSGAEAWGLWRRDPGPRGVRLADYARLKAAGVAPAGWTFDSTDWWLEEHGLIMEPPEFPVGAGRYLVTGDRETTSVLTIHPVQSGGEQRWELGDGATLYDVTHLRCRSARYTPAAGPGGCSPASAEQAQFPVAPGAEMPAVRSCNKQDYTVLLVIGMPVDA